MSKAAIKEAIKSSQIKLEGLKRAISSLQQAQINYDQESEANKNKYTSQLTELEHNKRVLVQTNTDLSHENIELKSSITVNQKELSDTLVEKANTELAVTNLTENMKALLLEQTRLEDHIQSKSADLNTLNEEFSSKKAEAEKELSILEMKKRDQATEILENRAQDDKVRENLADWQRKLEEKDQNLRIREARNNEKEKSIARNYNLLNI